jgi:hypothetical protein
MLPGMGDGQDQGYTRGERAAGIFGLLLFIGLAVMAADLASGGRLFRRGGCGCPEEEPASDG